MTDYDRDYYNWKHDQSKARDFEPAPNRNDYDLNGYKKGSVVYEGDLILDSYLIKTYGIEYARQNPLNRLFMFVTLYIIVGWIWQFPQTLLGWFLSRFFKTQHIGPAGFKFVLVRSPGFPVMCLGEYLFIGSSSLTRFCYGRGVLSRKLGPLFIPLVSLPSIALLLLGKNWFMSYWGTIKSMKNGIKVRS